MYHEGLSFLFLSFLIPMCHVPTFVSKPLVFTVGLSIVDTNPHQRLSQLYLRSAGCYHLLHLHFSTSYTVIYADQMARIWRMVIVIVMVVIIILVSLPSDSYYMSQGHCSDHIKILSSHLQLVVRRLLTSETPRVPKLATVSRY